MSSAARLHMYLKGTSIEVSGEATDLEFLGQLSLDDWSWKLSRGTPAKNDRTSPRAEPDPFRFSKRMDKASTQMLSKMKAGEKLSAIVTLVEVSDQPFQLVLRFKGIRIVEYKLEVKDDQSFGEATEDWTFVYDEVTFEHTPEARSKGAQGSLNSTLKRSPNAPVAKSEPEAILRKFDSLLTDSERNEAASLLAKKYPKLLEKK